VCFYILVPLLLSNWIMLLPHVCSFCFYINSFRYTVCCIGHTDISFTFFQKKKKILVHVPCSWHGRPAFACCNDSVGFDVAKLKLQFPISV